MKLIKNIAAIAVATSLMVMGAHATIVFTATGSDSDGALDGQASFTFGNGYVTIVLVNLVSGANLSQGQALSGITFAISGVTAASTFGQNFNGNTVNLNSNGTYTADPTDSGLPNWKVAASTGSIELATTGVIGFGGKPEDLIIPGGTTYVGGIGSHNPYVLNSATFTLSNALFTTSSTVSGVSLLFGTSPDKILAGCQVTAVPEPSTAFAGALLLIPLGVGILRAVRKQPTA